jgi:ABC-type Fe3+-hydroxamate transport system substrate-binding protein
MTTFRDQMGREVSVPHCPQRIVSLVPSITEYLFALGLGERVVGITKFCIYPEEWFQSKPRVGGTKNPDMVKIQSLAPDVIIGNKEENRLEDIEALERLAPVWMSDVNSIEDMYDFLASMACVVGCEEKGAEIIEQWKGYFRKNSTKGAGKKALYAIWKDPVMVVGKDTYIDAYLEAVGYQNCVHESRYPRLEELENCQPEVVLLSTEPYPFKVTDFSYFQRMFPEAEITLVSGEEFSWYGARNIL